MWKYLVLMDKDGYCEILAKTKDGLSKRIIRRHTKKFLKDDDVVKALVVDGVRFRLSEQEIKSLPTI